MDPNWEVMDSLKKNSVESYTILNDMKLYPLTYVSPFLVFPRISTCYTDEMLFNNHKT